MCAFPTENVFSYNSFVQPANTTYRLGAENGAILDPSASPKATRRSRGLGRKQACSNCRSRKKACDSKLPVCSLCSKHEEVCVYTTPKPAPPLGDERQTRALRGGYNGTDEYYLTACSAAEPSPSWESFTGHPQPLAWHSSMPPEFGILNQSWPASEHSSTDQGTTGSYRNSRNSRRDSGWTNSGGSSRGEHPDSLSSSDAYNPRPDTLSSRVDPDQESHRTRASSRSFVNTPLSQEPEQYSSLPASASTYQASERGESAHSELGKPLSPAFTTTSKSSARMSEMTGSSAAQTGTGLSTTTAESPGSLPPESFPLSTENMVDLLEIFFADYHPFLPCIHHRTYLDHVKSDTETAKSSPLFWALLSVAVSRHGQSYLRCLQHIFLARARSIFDRQSSQIACSIQTLQAAVWVVFQTYTSGDLTEAWLFLGKACRLAALLRLDRIDHDRAERSYPALRPRNEIEKEEQRKTVWTLFLLDRFISCFVGFPLAIDERQFRVNFPIDDDIFQNVNCSDNLPLDQSVSFTTDLTILMGPYILRYSNSKPSIGHIYYVSVLLGCILTFHTQLHLPHDSPEYRETFASLENITSLFSFALSKPLAGKQDTDSMGSVLHLWLKVLVQTCSVLLFCPTIPKRDLVKSGPSDERIKHPMLELCANTIRSMLDNFRSTATRSPQTLLNPFLLSSYFLCSRFLILDGRNTQGVLNRDSIDLVLMLVDRVGEEWAPLAKKIHGQIIRDATRSTEEIQQLQSCGTCDYFSVGLI